MAEVVLHQLAIRHFDRLAQRRRHRTIQNELLQCDGDAFERRGIVDVDVFQLFGDARRELVRVIELPVGVDREHEARRHRQSSVRQFTEIGTLSADDGHVGSIQ